MDAFDGRVAVIAGAGSGPGRALADAAAGLGMKLVLADADAGLLERATDDLQAAGHDVLALVCDLGKAAHVEELADAALARFHGVHLLFNPCCGAQRDQVREPAMWEVGAADWEHALNADLGAALHGVRVFVPLMLEVARRDPGYQGHVVHAVAADALADRPAAGPAHVAARAVLALTDTLCRDLRAAGAPIGASLLCMGAGVDDPGQQVIEALRTGRFFAGVAPQGQASTDAALPLFGEWLRGATKS